MGGYIADLGFFMTLPELSNREREVIDQLLTGKSNKQIALALGISVRTVEFHLKNIYEKYGVTSRVELVLKLGDTSARVEPQKLGETTVAAGQVISEDGNRFNPMYWAGYLKEAIARISKELKVEDVMNTGTRKAGNPLTFFEAIRICLAKYADFNGRASRAEFWWFALFITLVTAALTYFSDALASVFLISMLLPFVAAGARRLRDSDKSPWWQLFLLVPVGGLVVMVTMWSLPPTPMPEPAQPE